MHDTMIYNDTDRSGCRHEMMKFYDDMIMPWSDKIKDDFESG